VKYTEHQQRAIDHWEGNLQIIACAGSGKTDVITRRIAKLVSTGVPKESIVAFTFTENAAEELKFRIRKHLQDLQPDDPEIGDMYVGTIHSFCYNLLQDFKPRYKAHDVLDEHKRVLFVSTYDNARRIGLRDLFKRSYRNFEKFCLNIDVVREEMIDPKLLPEEFRKCFENYIKLLDEECFLDFSGMMHLVYHYLLSDVDFATKVFNRIQYVIVDEYQDINPLQEKLIELLTDRNGNLCVVGDDDQCIYQWRGTDVSNILTFTKRYIDVESIEITTNFRSSDVIVNSAKEVIERNFERLPKEISSWNDSKIIFETGDIYAINFESNLQELEFVLEKIKSLRGKKYINNRGEEYAIDYRDMAIFFRSVKNSADPYIQAFKDHNIPFIVKGGGKLFEQEEVLLVVKSIAFLGNFTFAGPTTINELTRLYNECFGSRGNVDHYLQQMQAYKSTKASEDYISLQGVFQMILSFLGATMFEFSETQLYNLGMLSQTITDFEAIYKRIKLKGIKYFLGFITGYAKWNYEEGGSDDPTKINAIKIMTVHRAKGLQFPVVFIPEVVRGLFPTRRRSREWFIPEELFEKERYEGTIEDERRLFYVALTRSEKYLFLSCHQNNINSDRRSNPSIFFEEFPKQFALTQPIPDPTDRKELDLSETALLHRFATSYSDLRYYDRCPFDYKLRFIFGFNPEIAIALGYGKSIHNILNIIHTDHRRIPPDFETVQQIVDDNFFLRYCTPDFMQRFKDSAIRIVQTYVKNFSGEFKLILETEKSFEFALDEALISGQIDLIKRLSEDGELEAIEIVDFKEHDNTEFTTDYRKQLRLYAIASMRALGLNPKRATVHHLDEGTRSEVDISKKVLTAVEKNISNSIQSIMKRVFPKHPTKRKCEFCDWRHFCTKKIR